MASTSEYEQQQFWDKEYGLSEEDLKTLFEAHEPEDFKKEFKKSFYDELLEYTNGK